MISTLLIFVESIKERIQKFFNFILPVGGGAAGGVKGPELLNTNIEFDFQMYVNSAICALIGAVIGILVKLAFDGLKYLISKK